MLDGEKNNTAEKEDFIDIEDMKKPIYHGHCSSYLGVLLAFFTFIHVFGKNSPTISKKLLALILLCLPKEHDFPDSIGKIKKVTFMIYFSLQLTFSICTNTWETLKKLITVITVGIFMKIVIQNAKLVVILDIKKTQQVRKTFCYLFPLNLS